MNLDQKRIGSLITAGSAVAGGILGCLLFFVIFHNHINLVNRIRHDSFHDDPVVTEDLFDRIDRRTLRTYLEWLSKKPHMALQQRDGEIADWIFRSFEKFGFDHVGTSRYNVLLSFPNPRLPNKVEMFDGNNVILHSSLGMTESTRALADQVGKL